MHAFLVRKILNCINEKDSIEIICKGICKCTLESHRYEIYGPISFKKALIDYTNQYNACGNTYFCYIYNNWFSKLNSLILHYIKQIDADIDIIISQTSLNYDIVNKSYIKNNGDIVNTIMELESYK